MQYPVKNDINMYILCSIPYEKSCHKTFSPCHHYSHRFPIPLPSLIYQFSALIYSKQILPNVMIDRAWSPIDYTLTTLTTWNADQTWQIKQAQMQGATMESVYWFHEGWKFIHKKKNENKTWTKYKDKISVKRQYKCNNCTLL